MATHIGHATHHMGPGAANLHSGATKDASKHTWDKDKIITIVGRIASVLSLVMYVSYVTQIASNLGGHPGSPWQPMAAFFNCIFWSIYGWFKPQRDWPIVVANVPGIFLAAATVITSFM